ncbi:hypothetical protein [Candidatus Accumulibacter aalborgensis]|uniref:hypothetical protein n=1 Tax=Candidatus Accumulibacter aalborgensis TaxID=1860102 RepID=UPI001FDF014A|nr:hypothetical protein [Candidatus Accumulibacter aalborgensis]
MFDQGTPAPLRHSLAEHLVETAFERGWANLTNGELISLSEEAGFAVFVTTDRNLKYQQNLAARSLSIVVLRSTSWPRIQRAIPAVLAAINGAIPGGYIEVAID